MMGPVQELNTVGSKHEGGYIADILKCIFSLNKCTY